MLIIEFIERWSLFIIFGISFMPLSIWNYETGEYRGFFRVRTIWGMLAILVAGGMFSLERGESWEETILTLAIGCLLVFVIPRIWVEFSHRRRFGVWLSASRAGEK